MVYLLFTLHNDRDSDMLITCLTLFHLVNATYSRHLTYFLLSSVNQLHCTFKFR